MEIKKLSDKFLKSTICNDILRALPNWFGIEESILEYVESVKNMPFFAVFTGDKPIGFIAIKVHNQYTAEICVMGILSEYHRKGMGRKLVEHAQNYCVKNGYKFLTVKTLDESRASKSYDKTRKFYIGMGFYPLEVFPLLWDEHNPCLFLAKTL